MLFGDMICSVRLEPLDPLHLVVLGSTRALWVWVPFFWMDDTRHSGFCATDVSKSPEWWFELLI